MPFGVKNLFTLGRLIHQDLIGDIPTEVEESDCSTIPVRYPMVMGARFRSLSPPLLVPLFVVGASEPTELQRCARPRYRLGAWALRPPPSS